MKDRIETEGIDVEYCPTEDMLADFFTKPLQGSLFEKFRKVIMGESHISSLRRPSLAPVKERVEDPFLDSEDEIKVQDVVPGANGRTPNNVVHAPIKATYANVVKRVGRKIVTNALKRQVKVTD
jgi:hypothetical protein